MAWILRVLSTAVGATYALFGVNAAVMTMQAADLMSSLVPLSGLRLPLIMFINGLAAPLCGLSVLMRRGRPEDNQWNAFLRVSKLVSIHLLSNTAATTALVVVSSTMKKPGSVRRPRRRNSHDLLPRSSSGGMVGAAQLMGPQPVRGSQQQLEGNKQREHPQEEEEPLLRSEVGDLAGASPTTRVDSTAVREPNGQARLA